MSNVFSNAWYSLSGNDITDITKLQEQVEELEKLLGNFKGLPEQVTELSDKFGGLSERFTELSGKFDGLSIDLSDKFNGLQEKFTGLQENFTGLEEKVETLTEAVGEQEKIMATCIIVSAVAAIVITSFVAFCIYQGVKCEREKEKNLSKDTPDAKLNNVDVDSTKKLPENTLMAVN
ncbi:MAG: hypothetical protein LBV62_03120 [Rickettsiales bacterium]|jgi:archaellum component FlaC|nr:hypothetical protein [Rickettsiales bacterium]